jgi:hypothetical protein
VVGINPLKGLTDTKPLQVHPVHHKVPTLLAGTQETAPTHQSQAKLTLANLAYNFERLIFHERCAATE